MSYTIWKEVAKWMNEWAVKTIPLNENFFLILFVLSFFPWRQEKYIIFETFIVVNAALEY